MHCEEFSYSIPCVHNSGSLAVSYTELQLVSLFTLKLMCICGEGAKHLTTRHSWHLRSRGIWLAGAQQQWRVVVWYSGTPAHWSRTSYRQSGVMGLVGSSSKTLEPSLLEKRVALHVRTIPQTRVQWGRTVTQIQIWQMTYFLAKYQPFSPTGTSPWRAYFVANFIRCIHGCKGDRKCCGADNPHWRCSRSRDWQAKSRASWLHSWLR